MTILTQIKPELPKDAPPLRFSPFLEISWPQFCQGPYTLQLPSRNLDIQKEEKRYITTHLKAEI